MRSADASRPSIPLALVNEGERVMRICNACRYCEGFCAVFPAMERRLTFTEQDLAYLANLCHDCRECYYSCQYAPPHEFAVDVPRTLAAIRRETYRQYAWPAALAGLFARQRLALLLAGVGAPLLVLALLFLLVEAAVLFGAHSDAEGAFYRVVPHTLMVGVFGILGLLVIVALAAGRARGWRHLGPAAASSWNPRALARAISDTLTLRYLDDGGDGCAYPDEAPSRSRRWFHQLTFYGFLLCFAATSVAAVYHNLLGWHAPYPLLSLPVVLGSVGGVGLLVGPAGLLWLKIASEPERADRSSSAMDVTFLVLLWLTSLTGFLLLALRESAAMGTVLALHLGVVIGLFVTMPYGKFVHAVHRFSALVRNALEETQTSGAPHPARPEQAHREVSV